MKRLLVITALVALQAVCAESALAYSPYMGEIRLFGFNFCPDGWATANGQILRIQDYSQLFNLYGKVFGGDGVNDFALPNLVGNAPVGVLTETLAPGGQMPAGPRPQGPPMGQTLPAVSTGANKQFGGLVLNWCVALYGYPAVPQVIFFYGEIRLFGFNFCPEGWAAANGQILPFADKTAPYVPLFAFMQTVFGGNGINDFGLPNLVGTVPVGAAGWQGLYAGQTWPAVSTGSNKQFGGVVLNWCVALQGLIPQRQ
jgi:microcystin-dependent protein